MVSESVLAAADDLYHMRIPEQWRRLAGDTAPPPNYNLASWLNDLTGRCQHFERILVHVSAAFGVERIEQIKMCFRSCLRSNELREI